MSSTKHAKKTRTSNWPKEWPWPLGTVTHIRTGKKLFILDMTRIGRAFVVEEGKDIDEGFIVTRDEVLPDPVEALRKGL